MHLLLRTAAILPRRANFQSALPFIGCHHGQQHKRSVASQPAQSQGFIQSIADSSAVSQVQNMLETIHEVSGLPWWATICVSTIVFRTAITLPLSVYQNKIFARLENIGQEMKDLVPEMKKETAIAIRQFKWTEEEAKKAYMRSMKKQYNMRVVRDNCHPFKSSVVIWAQLPMWLGLSMALRNMSSASEYSSIESQITLLELSVGGFLWIPNLTFPDSSWILPVFLGLVNLAIIELQVAHRLAKNAEPNKLQKYMTYFFRAISIVMVPVAATVPSSMSLYWTTSSVCGLCHNLIIISPKFRRLTKIPLSIKENQNPYQTIIDHFRTKLRL
jgi:mitochondrial inner membrane protein COX18